MASLTLPLIVGEGTPEREWEGWSLLHRISDFSPADLLRPDGRIVIVTPHPDDEILGCGGLLAMLAGGRNEIRILAVTDGEGSHPNSHIWPRARLAKRRRQECRDGITLLGLRNVEIRALSIGDGEVSNRTSVVGQRLSEEFRPTDLVVCTWDRDGHPDHDAVGSLARRTAAEVGCRLVQMPIWMWHWARPADPRVPWSELRRLKLTHEAKRRKLAAMFAHKTQLSERDNGLPPVLGAEIRMRAARACEYYFFPPEI